MKLVGASNWFIRGPFVLEGMLRACSARSPAVILLVLGKELVLPATIVPRFDAGEDVTRLAVPGTPRSCCSSLGLMLGAAGSALTLRRFLRSRR